MNAYVPIYIHLTQSLFHPPFSGPPSGGLCAACDAQGPSGAHSTTSEQQHTDHNNHPMLHTQRRGFRDASMGCAMSLDKSPHAGNFLATTKITLIDLLERFLTAHMGMNIAMDILPEGSHTTWESYSMFCTVNDCLCIVFRTALHRYGDALGQQSYVLAGEPHKSPIYVAICGGLDESVIVDVCRQFNLTTRAIPNPLYNNHAQVNRDLRAAWNHCTIALQDPSLL